VALERARGVSAAQRLAMFAAVTLGVLIKGPIMLAWALGGSLAAALVLRGRSPLRWLAWWPGWALVLAVAGGWFALALARHPEYAHYAFVEESFERFSSGSFRREQPWWFVPAVLAGGALPWSLATPWSRPRSDASRIAAGFVLFAAVFFTFSRSKLVTYLLPAIPALAWWSAEAWGRRGRLPRPLVAALFLAPLVLTAGSPWLVRYARSQSGEPLARALARAGAATVVYQDCYSPGSDFLLNRRSAVVSAGGHVLASNYVVRYRDLLRRRGRWLLFSAPEDAPAGGAVVVPVRHADDARRRYGAPFFEDERFAAFRRGAAR
jgi:4-amino-4-deoxy-L-arabinose transferase-like glycosyltransferase